VGKVEECCISATFDLRLLCRRADQLHIAEPLGAIAMACLGDHRGRLFDTDDVALGADLCLKSLQTQPGAAPDIQNGVARPEGKPFDRQAADLFERGKFQIVGRRARLVLRDRGLSVTMSPGLRAAVAHTPVTSAATPMK